jgi:ferric-dicitrate binding protein FerR (iron transport regulator)
MPDHENPIDMKTGLNNRDYNKDFARYLCDEMDKAEKAVFEEQLAGSEEDFKMTEKMKEKWKAMEKYQDPALPDARKAWDKLHTRLRDENLIPAESRKPANRFVPVVLRYAAVAVILAGIAAAFYFGFSHKNRAEMVQINTTNEQNTLIKTLADGSVVYLAQNSVFSFPQNFETNGRNVELSGEAFFDITPDPGKPFTIETGQAIIEVLGTAFNVKTGNGGNFELIVDRGKVKVTLKDHPSVSELVTAGEMVKTVDSHVVKSKSLSAGSHAWYTRRMQFKDETLQNILSVINRNFNTTFVTANQEIGNRKLTVTFSGETPEAMTDLICQAFKLKSQAKDGAIILSDNTNSPEGNRQ